jgi:hypothetical protein
MRRIAQYFRAVGGTRGKRVAVGNDLLSTVKMVLWDLERVGWRGDFVNCALLDLFFACFTFVQICTLKLPPFLFLICSGSERYIAYAGCQNGGS